MKGIIITESNRGMLAERYDVEDPEDFFPLGYIVLAAWGDPNQAFEGILSSEQFAALYTWGNALANGWVEAVPK